MPSKRHDPWRLMWVQPYVDSRISAAELEQDLERNDQPDFRILGRNFPGAVARVVVTSQKSNRSIFSLVKTNGLPSKI
jgi:hypothetical protein